MNLREILQQPVAQLLGVGPEASTALRDIGVETIFDLGSSRVFAQAASVVAASTSVLGSLPSDLLTDGATATPVTDAAGLPLDRLQGLPAATATALSDALDVTTIRELAFWPPRQVAHSMVATAAGTRLDGQVEEELAEELRPRFGEYPTERVYYDSLVMLGSGASQNLTELAQPLSLAGLANQSVGFGAPAVGALATYEQSWFAQGVTLGHMVHSLALAPGEATRVAVVDWTRRTRATASESIDELEKLDNSTSHARAVSEVQNAVADEMQSGGSIATGWAKSTSKGKGAAVSVGGGVAGVVSGVTGAFGFGGGGSVTSQESETESSATSTSWSVGSRSVLAEMNQRVNDRTEQHATSVRNRRATAVREVSQNEHEEVSTRIVANYNHMHALTVQYYEVVQIYRVSVRLRQFVRALFLPFELLDFSASDADDLVARFRGQFLDAALTPRAAQLLLDDRGRVEVRSAIRVPFPINVGALREAEVATAATVALAARRAPGGASVGGAPTGATTAPGTAGNAPGDAGSSEAAPTASRILTRFTAIRPGPVAEVLPGDARLVSVSFEDVGIARVRVDRAGATAEASTFVVPSSTGQVDFADRILLREVEGVHVARDGSAQDAGSMVLRYESEGHESIAVVPLSLGDGTNMQKVAFFTADAADRRAELHAHLQANRAYYTRAVLETLDAASLVMLLSGTSWQGRPLADQIEPNPIAVTGNYLVLRAPAEDGDPSGLGDNQTWGDLLKDRDVSFQERDTRLVPIPTGGVFAEAVLGRSNAAEKLDITRFWNWQDSPIPLQPPEIAPVGTGSRATAEALTPGQLGAPVLNLMAPTALPEPAGLAAALGALANGSMFRDMSGLAGTQAAAQAASAGTLTAATEAGRIASENYRIATNQATEMGKAAADMWKVLKGSEGGGSGSTSTSGISADGARINHGRDLDRRGVAGTGTGGAASAPRVTEQQSEFAGSRSEVTPRTSRELVYSDESAAVSPDLVGETTTALSGGSDGAAPGGPLGFLGEAVGDLVDAVGELPVAALEALLLTNIRSDAVQCGINLQGVDLIPMRKHDNAAEFEAKPVEFAAWTNNAKHVYVNLKLYWKMQSDDIAKGMSATAALNKARATFVVVLRHEVQHVTQFQGNGNKPPADFAKMIEFEAQAYPGDVVWLQDPANVSQLVNGIGTTNQVVTDLEAALDFTGQLFGGWHTSLQNEPDRLRELKAADLLPGSVRGKPAYVIGDLYKTKAP